MNKNTKIVFEFIGGILVIGGGILVYLQYVKGISPVQIANTVLQSIPLTNNNEMQTITSDGAINNFTNLEASNAVTWEGEILSPSSKFKSFSSADYNFRATRLQLMDYYNGTTTGTPLKTLGAALAEFDGGVNNDANYVAAQLGVSVNDDLVEVMDANGAAFFFALAQIETGENIVNPLQASLEQSASNSLNLT